MTVSLLAQKTGCTVAALPCDKQVQGAYCGDLLSWVMGRAREGNAWITIMSNTNVIAVASLADVSCVIFAEGVTPEQDLIALANEKNINLLCSPLPVFETAVKVKEALA